MRKATAIAATAAASLAIAMGLAGCGGGGDDAPPENPILKHTGGWVFTGEGTDRIACNITISLADPAAAKGAFTGSCRSFGNSIVFDAAGEVDSEGRLASNPAMAMQLKGALQPTASGSWTYRVNATDTTGSGTWTGTRNAS